MNKGGGFAVLSSPVVLVAFVFSSEAIGQSPPEAATANAADSNGADAGTIEVRVIGTKPDALRAVPGSGTVVSEREIARAEPLNVGEMLRRVPGLQVREDEGAGLRLDVGVRGLDGTRSRRVLMLEDGIPLAVNPYGEPDVYYGPPIERMRGIEVVKGSGSILFGPQTIGGVINFLTIAPPWEREARIDVRAGFPGYLRLLGRFGDAVGNTRYVAQVFHKRGDSGREQPFQSTDALAKICFPTSDKGQATLKIGVHDEVVSSTDVGLTSSMFEQDPNRPNIAPDDEVRVRQYNVSLVHEHDFTNTTKLRTFVYAYTTSRIWRRQDYDRTQNPAITYARIVGDTSVPFGAIFFRPTNTIRDRRYDVFGIEPRLERRFSQGMVQHTLDIGARFLVESARRDQRAGQEPRTYAGSTVSAEAHRSLAFAGYIQDRMVFPNDISVIPGLRIEHVRSRREISRAAISGVPTDVSMDGTNVLTALIPGIGMVVGPPRVHFFGGLHVGFAPPRVANTISVDGLAEDLDEERSLNYEFGGRFAPRKWLRFEATGFLSNFENQIIPSNRAGGATTDLVNGGRTRHMGAESAAVVKLGNALGWGFALDLATNYTFLRATFVDGAQDGDVLPYAPLHTVSTILDVEHPVGLGGEFAWTYISSQLTDDRGTINADASGRVGRIDGYPTLDAGLRYRHARTGLSMNLTMKNFLNNINVASRRPDGIFPTRMRQILLGVRWDYH